MSQMTIWADVMTVSTKENLTDVISDRHKAAISFPVIGLGVTVAHLPGD